MTMSRLSEFLFINMHFFFELFVYVLDSNIFIIRRPRAYTIIKIMMFLFIKDVLSARII